MYNNKQFLTAFFIVIPFSFLFLTFQPKVSARAATGTYTVASGNVTVEKEVKASLIYPSKTVIRYDGQDAIYVSSSVKHGQQVEAGDLIMTVTPKTNPVDIEEKELELIRLNNNLENDLQLKNNELTALRNRINTTSDNWEVQKLQLDLQMKELDLAYETARRKREINRKESELNQLHTASNAVEIRTSVSGIVSDLLLPAEGDTILQNTLICSIEDPSFCIIKAISCPFPFGSQVQITGKYGNEDLKMDAAITGSSSTDDLTADQFVSYLLPEKSDITFESVHNLSITGTTLELQNVLLIPTKTVHSNSDKNFVYLLMADGKRQKQYVKSKVITSDWTWVIDGLSEGQLITFN